MGILLPWPAVAARPARRRDVVEIRGPAAEVKSFLRALTDWQHLTSSPDDPSPTVRLRVVVEP